ncbi:MAG TPA: hypothetical protein PK691_03705, partial [Thermomicrobiales bacterium]|nr:hypothetical protein [Thermomicrobiales bacterium]
MPAGDSPARYRLLAGVQTATLAVLIAVTLLIPRLHNLDASVTPDEPRWVARSANFGLAMERRSFADTWQAPHPGVTVMWLGATALWIRGFSFRNSLSGEIGTATVSSLFTHTDQRPIDILVTMRQNIIAANVALYVLFFLLLTTVTGRWIAGAATLFLGLDPMQIGFTRLLHMDGLSTTCLLVSLIAWSVWLITRSRSALVLSAIVGGLGIATRSVDAMLVVFLAGTVMVDSLAISDRTVRAALQTVRKQIVPLALWSAIAAATFVASWPAMWVAPITTLRQLRTSGEDLALRAHAGNVLFRGEVINHDPGLLFYPIMLFIRTTPLTLVGLVAAAIALAVPVNPILKRLIVHTLTFATLYTITITIAAKKLDRYALPTMGALNLLAIFGFIALGGWMLTRFREGATWPRLVAAGGLATVLLLQAGIAIKAAPYFGDYISPLMGGRQAVLRRYSLFNAEGGQAIAHALATHPELQADGVAGTNWPRSTDFYLPWRLDGTHRGDTPEGLISLFANRYLILTQPEIARELYPPRTLTWLQSLTPILTVHDQGQPIAWIYDMWKARVPVAALGPDWPACQWENGTQLLAATSPEQAAPGTRIRVQTLWQSSQVPAMGTVLVELTDQQGIVIGSEQRDLAPTASPLILGVPLTMPPDLPEGTYQIRLT